MIKSNKKKGQELTQYLKKKNKTKGLSFFFQFWSPHFPSLTHNKIKLLFMKLSSNYLAFFKDLKNHKRKKGDQNKHDH